MTINIMIQAPRGEFKTGYAKIAHPIAEYLSKNKDYNIFYLCGTEKAFRKSNNKITYLPIKNDNWGGDLLQNENVLFNYLTHFKIHYNLTFLDTWTGNSSHLASTHMKAKTDWIVHQTINTTPISPHIINHSKGAFYHVAPSNYVYENLVTSGFSNTELIPHFVDLKVFKPTNNKAELKKVFGFEETDFVYFCVSKNNTGHKNLVGLMNAFKFFKKRNPDSNAFLLLLSDPKENDTVSPDLNFVRHQLGLEGSVFFVWAKYDNELKEFIPVLEGNGIPHFQSIGFSDEQMNKLYNMCDWLVIPSLGESFGLPVLEAQACGIPSIVGDHSTGQELVGLPDTGMLVGVNERVYNPNINAWSLLPSTEHLGVLIEHAYKNREHDFFKKCIRNAKKYDKKLILQKWGGFFQKLVNEPPKTQYMNRLML